MDGWVGELEYRREEWIYMDIPDGWVVEWLDGWMDGWTNLSSLFLQNYFKKRGISIVFFCEKLGLVALLAATRYLVTNRQRVT